MLRGPGASGISQPDSERINNSKTRFLQARPPATHCLLAAGTVLVGTYTQTRHRLLEAPAERKSIVAVVLNSGDAPAACAPTAHKRCTVLLHHSKYFDELFAPEAAGAASNDAKEQAVDGEGISESEKAADPLLDMSVELAKIFRTAWFEAMGLAATTADTLAMVLDGSLSAAQDAQLALVQRYCAFFFLGEFVILVACEASVASYFRRSAHAVFEFALLCFTTTALIADALGVAPTTVAVLRAPAMFRLVRFAKFGARWRSLALVWSVFRDFGLALVPLANSALFFLAVAWCVLVFFVQCLPGRALFLLDDGSGADPEPRSMAVFTLPLFTGAGWTEATLSAMAQGCSVKPPIGSPSLQGPGDGVAAQTDRCDQGRAFFFAVAFVVFYWLTQFICAPFLLALVLENFGVCKILATSIPDPARMEELSWELARSEMAAYYYLPIEAVPKSLVDRAITELHRDTADPHVPRAELRDWLLFRRPQRLWRFCKWIGLVRLRSFLRRRICRCLKGSRWFPPYPGDVDWVAGRARSGSQLTKEELAQLRQERQRKRLEDAAPKLRELMTKLVKQGMAGEVRAVAARMNISADLPASVIDADPAVAFKLLQDPFLAKRLGLQVAGAGDTMEGLQSDIKDDDIRGSSPDPGEATKRHKKPDSRLFRLRQSISAPFRSAVNNKGFEAIVFVCIFISCIFMFYETPAAEIEPTIPRAAMDIAGFIFLLIFTAEAAAKIIGFGLIYSVSWDQKPYLYEFWNRIDGSILVVNWLQYLGFLNVAGKYTTQVLRISKGLKLIQLIQFSSIKSMADSLAACFKPLLLVVLCLGCFISIFGVLGMAFFRGTFAYCTDLSIDGQLSQGMRECSGTFIESENLLFRPRTWETPPSNFDTFLGSIMTLWSVYSPNWIFSLYSAEDSNKAAPGIQPIQNQNEAIAIGFFFTFVMCIRLFLTSM